MKTARTQIFFKGLPSTRKKNPSFYPGNLFENQLVPPHDMDEIDKLFKKKLNFFLFRGDPYASWKKMERILKLQTEKRLLSNTQMNYALAVLAGMLLVSLYFLRTKNQALLHLKQAHTIYPENLDGRARGIENKDSMILQDSEGNLYTISQEAWEELKDLKKLCLTPFFKTDKMEGKSVQKPSSTKLFTIEKISDNGY